MFDTSVINNVVNNYTDFSAIKNARKMGYNYFVTNIQLLELQGMCFKKGKWIKKIKYEFTIFEEVLKELNVQEVHRGADFFAHAGKGFPLDGSCYFLDSRGAEIVKNIEKGNCSKHRKDALIFESAVRNKLVLITSDIKLYNKAQKEEAENVILYDDFIKTLEL